MEKFDIICICAHTTDIGPIILASYTEFHNATLILLVEPTVFY